MSQDVSEPGARSERPADSPGQGNDPLLAVAPITGTDSRIGSGS